MMQHCAIQDVPRHMMLYGGEHNHITQQGHLQRAAGIFETEGDTERPKGGAHKRRSSILKTQRAPLDEVDQNFLTETTEKRRRSKRVSFSGTTDIKIYERDILQVTDESGSRAANVAPSQVRDGQLPVSEEAHKANLIAGLLSLPIKQVIPKDASQPNESEISTVALLRGLSLHTARHEDAMSLTMASGNLHGISAQKTRVQDESMNLTLMHSTNAVGSTLGRTVFASEDVEETCLQKSFAHFGGSDDAEGNGTGGLPQVHAPQKDSDDLEEHIKLDPLPFLKSLKLLGAKQQESGTAPRMIEQECPHYKAAVQDINMSITMAPHVDDNAYQGEVSAGEEDMEPTCFEKSFACFDVYTEESDSGNNKEKVADVALKGGIEDNHAAQQPGGPLSPDGLKRPKSDAEMSSLEGISPICLARSSPREAVSVMEDPPSILPCRSKNIRLHSTMIGEVECTRNIQAALHIATADIMEGCNTGKSPEQTPAPAVCRLSPVTNHASGVPGVAQRSPTSADVERPGCVSAMEEKEVKCPNSMALESCMDITGINDGITLQHTGALLMGEIGIADGTDELMKSASRLINADIREESEGGCIFTETSQVEEKKDTSVQEKMLPVRSCVDMECTELSRQGAKEKQADNVGEENTGVAVDEERCELEHSCMKVLSLSLEAEQSMPGTTTPRGTVVILTGCHEMGEAGEAVSGKHLCTEVPKAKLNISEGTRGTARAASSEVQLEPPPQEQLPAANLVHGSPPRAALDPGVFPSSGAFQTEPVTRTCFSDMHFTCVPSETAIGTVVGLDRHPDPKRVNVAKKGTENTVGSTMQYTCVQHYPEEADDAASQRQLMMPECTRNQDLERDISAVTPSGPEVLNTRTVLDDMESAKGSISNVTQGTEAASCAPFTRQNVTHSGIGDVPTENAKKGFSAVNPGDYLGVDLENEKAGSNKGLPVPSTLPGVDAGHTRAEDRASVGQESVLLNVTQTSFRAKGGQFFATSLLSATKRQYAGFGSVDAFKLDHRESVTKKVPPSRIDVSRPLQRALFPAPAKHDVVALPSKFDANEMSGELNDPPSKTQSVPAEALSVLSVPPLVATAEERRTDGCKTSLIPNIKIPGPCSSDGSDNLLHESMPSFSDDPPSVKKYNSSTDYLPAMGDAVPADLCCAKLQQCMPEASPVPNTKVLEPANETAEAPDMEPNVVAAPSAVPDAENIPCANTLGSAAASYIAESDVVALAQRKSATFTILGSGSTTSAVLHGTTTMSQVSGPEVINIQQKSGTFTVARDDDVIFADARVTSATPSDAEGKSAVPTLTVTAVVPMQKPATPSISQPRCPVITGSEKSFQSSVCRTTQSALQDKPRTPSRINLSAPKRSASPLWPIPKQTKVESASKFGSASEGTLETPRTGARLKSRTALSQTKAPTLAEATALTTVQTSVASTTTLLSTTKCVEGEQFSKRHGSPRKQATRMTKSSAKCLRTSTSSEVKCLTSPATTNMTCVSTSKKARLAVSKKTNDMSSVQRATASTSKKLQIRSSIDVTAGRKALRSSLNMKKLQSARPQEEKIAEYRMDGTEKGSLSPAHKFAQLSNGKGDVAEKAIPSAGLLPVARDGDTFATESGTASRAYLADSVLSGISEIAEDSIDTAAADSGKDIDGELELTVGTDELIERLQRPTPEDFLQQFFWGAYEIKGDDRHFVVTEASENSAEFSFMNGRAVLTVMLEESGVRTFSRGEKVCRGVKDVALVCTPLPKPASKFVHKMFLDAANPSSLPQMCKTNGDLAETLRSLCKATYRCRCFAEDYTSAISGNPYTFNDDGTLRVQYLCDDRAWWFYVIFRLDHVTYPNAVIYPTTEIKWGPENLPQCVDDIVRSITPGKMYLSRMVKGIAKSLKITTFDDILAPLLGKK